MKNYDELIERLENPWPTEFDAAEVTLPVWIIELCDEARQAILELSKGQCECGD